MTELHPTTEDHSMVAQPPSSDARDFVTIFKTGSVDRDDYPELAEHLLEGRTHSPRRQVT
jgi:hypothetical protein